MARRSDDEDPHHVHAAVHDGHDHGHDHGHEDHDHGPGKGEESHGGHGHHGHGHQGHHDHAAGANERSLTIAFGLTATLMVVEFVAGWWSSSLALISDAGHMLTDTAALGIALAAIRIARRPADERRTFGYHRLEILAAAFNAMMLFGVAVFVAMQAWERLHAPPEIHSTTMLLVAVLGLLVNFLSMRVLAAGRDESLNLRGAYLEVMADMFGSVGVIVGALVIRATGWWWVDSVVALGIALWVVPRAWSLLKSSVNILLEGVPEGVELRRVQRDLSTIDGVRELHDLHIWAVGSGKISLTVHLVVEPGVDGENRVVPEARRRMQRHGIGHVTVQCEHTPCAPHEDAVPCAIAPPR